MERQHRFPRFGYKKRLSAGFKVAPGEFPSYVQVNFVNIVDLRARFCDGTLIHKDLVVTAAHCIDETLKGYVVAGGLTNQSHEALLRDE